MQEILSLFHVDAQLLIAQLINFAVLMVLIVYVVVRPLRKVLDDREATIREGIDNAIHAETKLAQAVSEAGGIITEAERDAHSIRVQAHNKAIEMRDILTAEMHREHDRMRSDFESELTARRVGDLQTFQNDSTNLVINSVQKILNTTFSDPDFSARYISEITKH